MQAAARLALGRVAGGMALVVCSGGSQPKSTAPAQLAITQDFFESLLPPELAWIRPFLPYVAPIVIDAVGTFCGNEPPGWPDPTGVAFAGVLAGGQVGASLVAAEVIAQVLLNALWYQLCECTSGTTPAIPTGPSAPTGLPVVNPPLVVTPPTAQPCLVRTSVAAAISPANKSDIGMGDEFPTVIDLPVPVGATNVKYTFTNNATGSTHGSITWFVNLKTLAGGYVTAITVVAASGTTMSAVLPVGSTVAGWNVQPTQTFSGATISDTATTTVEFFCGSYPGQPQSSCCPPDPIMTGLLAQIRGVVDLIQSQAAPFGYVPGASHVGLTGNGSFAVQGLIGCSVDVTTLPDSYGRAAGEPVELYGLGFITFGTADGYELSRRLDHDGSLILPPQAGAFTVLGYSLAPGVVVTIQELTREP